MNSNNGNEKARIFTIGGPEEGPIDRHWIDPALEHYEEIKVIEYSAYQSLEQRLADCEKEKSHYEKSANFLQMRADFAETNESRFRQALEKIKNDCVGIVEAENVAAEALETGK